MAFYKKKPCFGFVKLLFCEKGPPFNGGSTNALNNKNDICELIELLCASRAGTCSRRPGQSL